MLILLLNDQLRFNIKFLSSRFYSWWTFDEEAVKLILNHLCIGLRSQDFICHFFLLLLNQQLLLLFLFHLSWLDDVLVCWAFFNLNFLKVARESLRSSILAYAKLCVRLLFFLQDLFFLGWHVSKCIHSCIYRILDKVVDVIQIIADNFLVTF